MQNSTMFKKFIINYLNLQLNKISFVEILELNDYSVFICFVAGCKGIIEIKKINSIYNYKFELTKNQSVINLINMVNCLL